MSKRVKKNKYKIKYLISTLSIIILLVASIYLYLGKTNQEKKLKELELKLETRKQQEAFVSKHQDDLKTIKKLKQEILGQQTKQKELSKQVDSFTDTLIKNEEKLNKLES